MPRYLINAGRTLRLSVRMARSFLHEGGAFHREGLRRARPLLEAARRAHGDALPSPVLGKVQWYMAHALWMGQLFGDLLGRRLTEPERTRYAYAGALGALSDVLVDEIDLADERLHRLFDAPAAFQPAHPAEHLFLAFHDALLDALPPPVRTERLDLMQDILHAQRHSKAQFDPALTTAEIDRLVREKGALSVCAYRGLLPETFGPQEREAVWELGALIQYINDVHDVYKDGRQGLRTFATERATVEDIARALDRQMTRAFRLLKTLPYERRQKENFLFVFYALVVGSHTTLHHYERLCGHRYALEALLQLERAAVAPRPFSVQTLARAVPCLLRYRYDHAERPVAFHPAPSI